MNLVNMNLELVVNLANLQVAFTKNKKDVDKQLQAFVKIVKKAFEIDNTTRPDNSGFGAKVELLRVQYIVGLIGREIVFSGDKTAIKKIGIELYKALITLQREL